MHNPKQIIKQGQIIDNPWVILDNEQSVSDLGEGQNPIVSSDQWLEQISQLANIRPLGILLKPDEDLTALSEHLAQFDVIAVDFPKFADGRGYSIARELRQTYGYQGEIRAVGDVLLDQLYYMQQVGFDAFALREDLSLERGLASFNDYKENYLGPTYQHNPWFKRA